jgi:hypothetical protein
MTVESAHSPASLGLPTPYAAPEGELEATIANIFGRVFSVDQVGADDDFFDLGGGSRVAETSSKEYIKNNGNERTMSRVSD